MEESCRVQVVKETLYVEKEGCGDMAMADGRLGEVGKVCSSINSGAVIMAAKLEWAEELVYVEIVYEVACNNFLQELATCF